MFRGADWSTRAPDQVQQVQSMAVWLRPPPPIKPREPEHVAQAQPHVAQHAHPERAATGQAQPVTPAHIIDEEPKDHAFTISPAPRGPDVAPSFDPDAARRQARAQANDADPARAGTALAQFPKPEYRRAEDTKTARAIDGAVRRNCKDGIPGGLLAPLVLLMDKKDSGCKW